MFFLIHSTHYCEGDHLHHGEDPPRRPSRPRPAPAGLETGRATKILHAFKLRWKLWRSLGWWCSKEVDVVKMGSPDFGKKFQILRFYVFKFQLMARSWFITDNCMTPQILVFVITETITKVELDLAMKFWVREVSWCCALRGMELTRFYDGGIFDMVKFHFSKSKSSFALRGRVRFWTCEYNEQVVLDTVEIGKLLSIPYCFGMDDINPNRQFFCILLKK